MKKLLSIFLFWFLLLSNLNSQIITGYGVKAGLSSATQFFEWSIMDNEKYNYRYGIYFGAFAELFDFQYVSLLVDISYNQKGMLDKSVFNKRDTTDLGYSPVKVNFNNRLDYITLNSSIKTRYKFGNITPYLLAGIKYDILIGKKIDEPFEGLQKIYNIYTRLYENYKGNLFGLTFGIGFEINELLKIPILIEWIYIHDLNTIRVNEVLKIQNISNELKIGVKF